MDSFLLNGNLLKTDDDGIHINHTIATWLVLMMMLTQTRLNQFYFILFYFCDSTYFILFYFIFVTQPILFYFCYEVHWEKKKKKRKKKKKKKRKPIKKKEKSMCPTCFGWW